MSGEKRAQQGATPCGHVGRFRGLPKGRNQEERTLQMVRADHGAWGRRWARRAATTQCVVRVQRKSARSSDQKQHKTTGATRCSHLRSLLPSLFLLASTLSSFHRSMSCCRCLSWKAEATTAGTVIRGSGLTGQQCRYRSSTVVIWTFDQSLANLPLDSILALEYPRFFP